MERERRKGMQEKELARFDAAAREVFRVVGAPVHQHTATQPDCSVEDRDVLLEKTMQRRTLRGEMPLHLQGLPEFQQQLVKFIRPNPDDEPTAPTALLDNKESVRSILNEYLEHSIDKSTVHEAVGAWVRDFPSHSQRVEDDAAARLVSIDAEEEVSRDALADLDAQTHSLLSGYGHLHELRAQIRETAASGVPMAQIRASILARRSLRHRDAGTTTEVIVNCGDEAAASSVLVPEGCRMMPAVLFPRADSESDESSSGTDTGDVEPVSSGVGCPGDGVDALHAERGARSALKQLEKLLLKKSTNLVRSLRHRELLVSQAAMRVARLRHELGVKTSVIADTRTELQRLFEQRGFAGPWTQNDDTSAVDFLRQNLDAILEDLRHELQREAHRSRVKALAARRESGGSGARPRSRTLTTPQTTEKLRAHRPRGEAISLEDINNVAGISDAMRASLLDALNSHNTIARLHSTVDRVSLQSSVLEAELAERSVECARAAAERDLERAAADALRAQVISLETDVAALSQQLNLRDERVDVLEGKLQTVMSANRIQETMENMKRGFQSTIANLRLHVSQLQEKTRAMQQEHDELVLQLEREREASEARLANEVEANQQVGSTAANRLALELIGLASKCSASTRLLRQCLRRDVGAEMREKAFGISLGLLRGTASSIRAVEAELLSYQPKLIDVCRRALREDLEDEALAMQHAGGIGDPDGSPPSIVDPSEAAIAALTIQLCEAEARAAALEESAQQSQLAASAELSTERHIVTVAREMLDLLQHALTSLCRTRSNDAITAHDLERPPSLRVGLLTAAAAAAAPAQQSGSIAACPATRVLEELWAMAKQAFLAVKHRLLAHVDLDAGIEGALRSKLVAARKSDADVSDAAMRALRVFANAVNTALVKPLRAIFDIHRDDPKWRAHLRKLDGQLNLYRRAAHGTGRAAFGSWCYSVRRAARDAQIADAITICSRQLEEKSRVLGDALARLPPSAREASGVPQWIREVKEAREHCARRLSKMIEAMRSEQDEAVLQTWRLVEGAVNDRVRSLRDCAALVGSMVETMRHDFERSGRDASASTVDGDLEAARQQLREAETAIEMIRTQLIESRLRCEQLEEAGAVTASSPLQGEHESGAPQLTASAHHRQALFGVPPTASAITPQSQRRPSSSEMGASAGSLLPAQFRCSTDADAAEVAAARRSSSLVKQQEQQSQLAELTADAVESRGPEGIARLQRLVQRLQHDIACTQARGTALVAALCAVMDLGPLPFDDDAAAALVLAFKSRRSAAPQRSDAPQERTAAAATTVCTSSAAEAQQAATRRESDIDARGRSGNGEARAVGTLDSHVASTATGSASTAPAAAVAATVVGSVPLSMGRRSTSRSSGLLQRTGGSGAPSNGTPEVAAVPRTPVRMVSAMRSAPAAHARAHAAHETRTSSAQTDSHAGGFDLESLDAASTRQVSTASQTGAELQVALLVSAAAALAMDRKLRAEATVAVGEATAQGHHPLTSPMAPTIEFLIPRHRSIVTAAVPQACQAQPARSPPIAGAQRQQQVRPAEVQQWLSHEAHHLSRVELRSASPQQQQLRARR